VIEQLLARGLGVVGFGPETVVCWPAARPIGTVWVVVLRPDCEFFRDTATLRQFVSTFRPGTPFDLPLDRGRPVSPEQLFAACRRVCDRALGSHNGERTVYLAYVPAADRVRLAASNHVERELTLLRRNCPYDVEVLVAA